MDKDSNKMTSALAKVGNKNKKTKHFYNLICQLKDVLMSVDCISTALNVTLGVWFVLASLGGFGVCFPDIG